MDIEKPRPPKYVLVERAIRRDLAEYLREQRSAGLHWEQIAADLSVLAGVELSRESVRLWGSAQPLARSAID